eukprot:CAMPEP_0181222654 /NCGR_PEP_ID=MMETSP1096-20121128/30084_1 /TAXON_ID=156174 ORGANISM="Chrysochromulina ericina, Strain CCMP281" /NCGR_SAMPLE_ID=MMETSP1096 /ASSEMBLY_ACC=CAM_ASM_000453 /LENGTH=77 /DNA_ID=CAMNT_0023315435 /DNA_START=269 /DNA_END=500 /DNA_ORIENTATION=-
MKALARRAADLIGVVLGAAVAAEDHGNDHNRPHDHQPHEAEGRELRPHRLSVTRLTAHFKLALPTPALLILALLILA